MDIFWPPHLNLIVFLVTLGGKGIALCNLQGTTCKVRYLLVWGTYGKGELCLNSTSLLVNNWLFCTQYLPCSIALQHMLGNNVEVLTKNILYRLMEDQTRFDKPRGAKINLVLNAPKWVALYSISTTASKHAPHMQRFIGFVWKIVGD